MEPARSGGTGSGNVRNSAGGGGAGGYFGGGGGATGQSSANPGSSSGTGGGAASSFCEQRSAPGRSPPSPPQVQTVEPTTRSAPTALPRTAPEERGPTPGRPDRSWSSSPWGPSRTTRPSARSRARPKRRAPRAFATQPVVTLGDYNASAVVGDPVQLAIATHPAGTATLTCTSNPVASVSLGVASFAGCSISGPVGAYTLSATDTADGLLVATSSTITLSPGTPTHLAFVQGPTSTTAGTAISPAVTVAVEDAAGNTETGDHTTRGRVDWYEPRGGTLTGGFAVTVVRRRGHLLGPLDQQDRHGLHADGKQHAELHRGHLVGLQHHRRARPTTWPSSRARRHTVPAGSLIPRR